MRTVIKVGALRSRAAEVCWTPTAGADTEDQRGVGLRQEPVLGGW